MADSEILYVVKANNTQAIQEFDKLGASQQKVAKSTEMLQRNTQNSNMLLMSTGRIVQDMPYGFMAVGNNITFMAEQMGYMRQQGMSSKDMLLGLGKAMIGPGGVIFAISAITSAITYFTSNIGRGKSAVDTFATSIDKAIKKLIEFQDPLKNLKFGLDPEQLNKLIPAIDREIKAIESLNTARQVKIGVQSGVSPQSSNAGIFLNQLTEKEKESIKINEQIVEQLKTIKTEYEAQLKVANLLEGLGLSKVEAETKVKDLLREQKKIVEETIAIRVGGKPGVEQLPAFGAGMTPLQGPSNQILNTEQIKEGFNQVNEMASGAASVLRSEFSSAWEDIFGEANSLFEKLLASMVSSLADAAATSLMGSFLNFLFPGAGALAGIAMGGTSNPTQVNLQLDKQTMATWYVGGKQQANRLRLD